MKLGRRKAQYVRGRLVFNLDMVEKNIETSKNTVRRAEQKQEIRSISARKIVAALAVKVSDLVKEPFF